MNKMGAVLLLSLTVILALNLFIIGWLLEETYASLLQTDDFRSQILLNDMVQKGCQAFIQKDDLLLVDTVKSLTKNNFVFEAFFLNTSGQVLAHTDKNKIGKQQNGVFTTKALQEKKGFVIPYVNNKEHFLDLAAPIWVKDRFCGLARLSIRTENTYQKVFFYKVVFFLCIILAALFLFLSAKKVGFNFHETVSGSSFILVNNENRIVAIYSQAFQDHNLVGQHILDVIKESEFSAILQQSLNAKNKWIRQQISIQSLNKNPLCVEIYSTSFDEAQKTAILIHIRES